MFLTLRQIITHPSLLLDIALIDLIMCGTSIILFAFLILAIIHIIKNL